MNFSFDSVKLKSKLQNEDFYYDIETPRGHFFAVLDFASHDYANLNATLTGKLETIVGSFASLSDFSDALFLGFLAKEINNFVSNLAEQSGGPELFFSAALCLVSGDRLSYFLSGDARIRILRDESLLPLEAAESQAQLGGQSMEAPMSEQVQAFTLQDADVALIMTQSVAEVFERKKSPVKGTTLAKLDPSLVFESIMKSSAAAIEDRTLVVISGPFERPPDPALPDLNAFAEFKMSLASLEARLDALGEFAEFKASLASLEARLDALAEREQRKQLDVGRLESVDSQLEQKFGQQVEGLKDDLRSKAAAIDLLEFDEKLKALSALLAGKADTALVLGLQRDVLRVSIQSNPLALGDENETADANAPMPAAAVTSELASDAAISPASSEAEEVLDGSDMPATVSREPASSPRPFTLQAALLVVAISLVAGFVGGWLHSRGAKKSPEVWSVKSSGNRIVISRLDGPAREDVTMNVAGPANASGEQTFSSFADVKQYVDTITNAAAPPTQTNPGNQSTTASDSNASDSVSEIAIKPGDTLQKLSRVYNVPPEKLMELNPTINRWTSIQIGQKIFVPAVPQSKASR